MPRQTGRSTPGRRASRPDQTAESGEPFATPEWATYLYSVTRKATKPAVGRVPPGLPGGTTPKLIPAGRSLWLAVSQVPLDRYGPGPLEASLRDLDWVSQVAVSHEAVVEHFAKARSAAVVPMKLFTMFSSEERAVAEMQARRGQIDGVLARIAGCEEWGVRVMRSATRAISTAPVPQARTGAAFLAARRQERDAARASVEMAARAAATVFDELSPIAKDARQRRDAPAGTTPPLLDAAFLVPSARRAKFRVAARRAAKACAEAGAEMTLTGPWPAYNFVQSPGEDG